MKFNSQPCTTKEQSERLLALGLKRETADCYLEYVGRDNYGNNVWHSSTIVNNYRTPDYSRDFPAWSLHRLIELLGLSKICLNIDIYDSPYEEIIRRIDIFINTGVLNREYLEE